MPSLPRILLCDCAQAGVLSRPVTMELRQALARAGRSFETVADLCELAARRDPRLAEWATNGELRIAACSPRAVKWLLAAAGVRLEESTCAVINLRTQSKAEALALLLKPEVPVAAATESSQIPVPAKPPATSLSGKDSAGWHAWFPVVDFERCTHCLECLGFCLFGVFGLDEQQHLRVQAPESCKANCPACARVCPEAAILFPKHNTGPINGEEVAVEGSPGEKIDISELLGGDVYARLRKRNQPGRPRFSAEQDSIQALRERQQWLAQLAELGNLSPEVLANLPEPDELQRLTQAARAKVPPSVGLPPH